MATKIEAAKLLTFRAGDLKNKGYEVKKESAMAKLYASEVAVEVATEGVQIFGGYGYTKDFPSGKIFPRCQALYHRRRDLRNPKTGYFAINFEITL